MNEIKYMNDLYGSYVEVLKKRVRENSKELFGCRLFDGVPKDKIFPKAVIKNTFVRVVSETLGKEDRRYKMTITIDIFAEELPLNSREEVVNKISEFLFDIMFNEFGFSARVRNVPNLDTNVYRTTIDCNAIVDIDTKRLFRA